MHQARSLSADDFGTDCPIPLDLLGGISRAEPDTLMELLDDLPETTRARLAVWLYGRSHTHALGVRIAATCDSASLRHTAGLVGNVLHDLSRRPYAAPDYGATRSVSARRVSLGGSARSVA